MLLTPGPVAIPEPVAAALRRPLLHHRSNAFNAAFASTRLLLREAFGGLDREVLLLTSSGSGALDAAVSNLLRPDDRVVSVVSGKFGERMASYAAGRGAQVERVPHDPRHAFDVGHLAERLSTSTRALMLTATETSTGAALDLQAILELAESYPDLLVIVDGIAWLGADHFPTNLERVDLMLGASQKAFAAPAGLAMAQLSPRAEKRLSHHAHYFDFAAIAKAQAKGEVAYTLSSPMLFALEAGLTWLLAQSPCPAGFHEERAKRFRAAAAKAGLALLPCEASNALSVIELPRESKLDADRLRDQLERETGFHIAAGQDQWQGTILRVGHMGAIDDATWQPLVDAIAGLIAS